MQLSKLSLQATHYLVSLLPQPSKHVKTHVYEELK